MAAAFRRCYILQWPAPSGLSRFYVPLSSVQTTSSTTTRSHWRLPTSSTRQLATKSSRSVVQHRQHKPHTVARSLQAQKVPPSGYESFVESIAFRSSPTLLYEAPSPVLFVTTCYVLGAGCLAYAGFNFYSVYLHPPDQIGFYLPVMVGGVCVFMAFAGLWLISGVYRVIGRITALPRKNMTIKQPLRLQIDNVAILPKFRPKSVVAASSDIIFSEFLFIAPIKLSPAERRIAQQQEDRKREHDKSRILTLPFRQASYWMWRGFQSIKKALWKSDFIYVQVKGRNLPFKLDRDAAWALDDGRALDRLVKHRLTSIKCYEEAELEQRLGVVIEPIAQSTTPKGMKCPLSILAEDNSIVQVIVGENKATKTWTLHRALLVKHAPFFRGALAPGHFIESTNNTITLPSDDNETFAVFVQWLYTIDSTFENAALLYLGIPIIDLIKAYCLGDMLGSADFKNVVISKLYDSKLWDDFQQFLTPKCVKYAFENSLPGCPLQKLVADICAYKILHGSITMYPDLGLEWKEFFDNGGDFVSEVLMRVVAWTRPHSAMGHDKAYYIEELRNF